MFINELPYWVPVLNIGISVVGVFVCLFMLLRGNKRERLKYLGFLAANLVLFAGALFQADAIALTAWIILGTGGRILNMVFLAIIAALDY